MLQIQPGNSHRLEEIAKNYRVTFTEALERAVLTYGDGIKAQDELRHENERLQVEVRRLQAEVESLSVWRERADERADFYKKLYDAAQKNLGIMIDVVNNQIKNDFLTNIESTTPTEQTDTMEAVQQPQAQNMTFRQWLTQWLAG